MANVILFVFIFGVAAAPLLWSVVCLGVGLWRRERMSTALLAIATVPPVLLGATCFTSSFSSDLSTPRRVAFLISAVVTVALLTWAIAAVRRGWRRRRLSALVALALPVPLMALGIVAVVSSPTFLVFTPD
jgi:hypothetical protein